MCLCICNAFLVAVIVVVVIVVVVVVGICVFVMHNAKALNTFFFVLFHCAVERNACDRLAALLELFIHSASICVCVSI